MDEGWEPSHPLPVPHPPLRCRLQCQETIKEEKKAVSAFNIRFPLTRGQSTDAATPHSTSRLAFSFPRLSDCRNDYCRHLFAMHLGGCGGANRQNISIWEISKVNSYELMSHFRWPLNGPLHFWTNQRQAPENNNKLEG